MHTIADVGLLAKVQVGPWQVLSRARRIPLVQVQRNEEWGRLKGEGE